MTVLLAAMDCQVVLEEVLDLFPAVVLVQETLHQLLLLKEIPEEKELLMWHHIEVEAAVALLNLVLLVVVDLV